MNVNELLKVWTDCAYKLLESTYDTERVKTLDKVRSDLSKVRIVDMTVYGIEEDGIIVRYKEKGSQTFKKVTL